MHDKHGLSSRGHSLILPTHLSYSACSCAHVPIILHCYLITLNTTQPEKGAGAVAICPVVDMGEVLSPPLDLVTLDPEV